MGLDFIQRDIQSILNNKADFAIDIVLTAPTSPVTVITTQGTVKKHHTTMDELGMPARTKGNTINATCTVSTVSLDAASYPYRNSEERVSFLNHIVLWVDISGTWTYKVEEWLPDEVTGNIVLILGFYAPD